MCPHDARLQLSVNFGLSQNLLNFVLQTDTMPQQIEVTIEETSVQVALSELDKEGRIVITQHHLRRRSDEYVNRVILHEGNIQIVASTCACASLTFIAPMRTRSVSGTRQLNSKSGNDSGGNSKWHFKVRCCNVCASA